MLLGSLLNHLAYVYKTDALSGLNVFSFVLVTSQFLTEGIKAAFEHTWNDAGNEKSAKHQFKLQFFKNSDISC